MLGDNGRFSDFAEMLERERGGNVARVGFEIGTCRVPAISTSFPFEISEFGWSW